MIEILATLALAATLATGCTHDANNAEATAHDAVEPVVVTTQPAAIAKIERSVSLVGAFYANEEVAIAAQIETRVAAFEHDMGDRVKAGDVLVRLDDADLKAALREIQARLAKAHADNARAQVLKQQGIMAAEEAEKMRTEAIVLEAQLDVVKVKIDRTVIRAPFTGVIAERTTALGAVVKIGQTLYKLVQDDPLKFRTPVPERFAGFLRMEQPIRVTVDAYPGRIFEGKITRINPTSETANRSITIEALVPNTERLLRPGFFAKGDLVYDPQGDVVVVPEKALTTFAGVTKVFVIVNGKAEERAVRTGVAVDDGREITDGVKQGELVAVSNLDHLEQGAPVTVTQ
ncbi:MAG: efflux RND transporter periplasmic adaptor subunit [Candidatus Binatia bacterium]